MWIAPMATDLSSYLIARGWSRDDAPADLLDECGADTEESTCGRLGRWRKPGVSWPLCAQHARRAEGEGR